MNCSYTDLMNTMCRKVFLDAPNIGDLEKEYLAKAVDSGFVSTAGPFVPEFEKKFAGYLNVERAVSTQSGTAALHMALYELGIGEGDEVIVPALTFVATINPVVYVGATPVIVDVSDETWTIDPQEVRKAVTSKTKAIIAVHLYGNPCDMDSLTAISQEYGLYLIEDATESLGATYGSEQTGTIGDIGCFSFNGNKVITTGGGGMVVSDDEEKLNHIKFLINQAKDKSSGNYHPEVGFNYRMTNIEAALGLAQIERLDEFLMKKRKFNEIYKERLKDTNFIRFQQEHESAESCRWLSCIVFEKKVDIPVLQKKLKEKSIPTRRIFMPVVEFPPYETYKSTCHKNSYRIYERGLCLPSSTSDSEEDIFYVCKILKGLI